MFGEKVKKLCWHTTFGAVSVEEIQLRAGPQRIRPFVAGARVRHRGVSRPLQRAVTDLAADALHGAIQFTGAFDTLTWESSSNEYWNGFTVGVQGTSSEVFPPSGVPEPTSIALLGIALAGLGLRRRTKS